MCLSVLLKQIFSLSAENRPSGPAVGPFMPTRQNSLQDELPNLLLTSTILAIERARKKGLGVLPGESCEERLATLLDFTSTQSLAVGRLSGPAMFSHKYK